jgi:hypothetical protein
VTVAQVSKMWLAGFNYISLLHFLCLPNVESQRRGAWDASGGLPGWAV